MRRVHLVHRREVVEVLQEDRRLHELVQAAARLLQDRAEILQRLLRLLGDAPAHHPAPVGRQTELAGDEDEAADLDSLVVGRSLERSGRALGADDLLLCHLCSPSRQARLDACARAAPSALKMASRTWRESSPSISRTCSVSPGRLRERLEEARGEVAAEPSRPRLGQIDVARDERPLGDLERDLGECFLRRQERRAVAAGSVGAQRAGKGLAERPSRFCDLGLRVARRQLERELEAAAPREQRQQVVEDRNARGDIRRSLFLGRLGRSWMSEPSRTGGSICAAAADHR